MVITRNRFLQHLYYVFVLLLLNVHMKLAAPENNGVGCIERERQALLKIKDELFDRRDFLSSWDSEEDKSDCCRWKGVNCSNRTGHITSLDLKGKGLRGKISQSLFELRHLTYLDLSFNDFGGTQFPIHNGSLAKLRYLNLAAANLMGNVSSMLGNLSNLQSLDLSSNNFHDVGNVEWLSGLSSSLINLDLSGNRLIKPNNWLNIANRLPLMESLKLVFCFFGDDIPLTLTPINSSSSLTSIYLTNNNLIFPSIYSWLSNISHNIKSLDLSYNSLEASTLADFGDMFSLQSLDLSDARLEGAIPKSFGNMCDLQFLYLSNNNFSMGLPGLIQNLSGCTQKSLQALSLDGNQMTGSLPDFTRFSSLSALSLGNNRLTGTVEKSFGSLFEIVNLDLGWNSLNGFISEDHFANMSNLGMLVLSGNSLTWNVSLNWVPPFRLYSMKLRSCNMGPHFPRWLQSQPNYLVLDISDNGISDLIPRWFWNLSSTIESLNLSHNNLRGSIQSFPLEFSPLSRVVIDISFNRLSGQLPSPLISSKLKSFFLPFHRSKLFNGDIVSGALIYLDFSTNQFSGVLRHLFTNAQDLVFLNFANNNLYGEIPASIGSLFKLEALNLQNNAFSGELPSTLKNCTRLSFLDLGGNRLFGNIPIWIGESLSALQFLRLKSNQFHGNIPLQLCQLTNVQILDLSFNTLTGTIPPCFNNLTAMSSGNSTATISLDYVWTLFGMVSNPSPRNLYVNKALVLWKGNNYMLDKNLGRFRIIDLSSNNIQGKIPRELLSLSALNQLNLSDNKLTGAIPQDISCFKLESLDLSQNQLSGRIPDSMASLNFLNTLNLSYNKFSGRIPSSTQLQSFNAYSFIGNPGLCGLPLTQKCRGDDRIEPSEEDGDEFRKWLYAGMGLGFSIGFWGVSGGLLLKRTWRHAYFKLLDKWAVWLYVSIVVFGRRLQRKFQI